MVYNNCPNCGTNNPAEESDIDYSGNIWYYFICEECHNDWSTREDNIN